MRILALTVLALLLIAAADSTHAQPATAATPAPPAPAIAAFHSLLADLTSSPSIPRMASPADFEEFIRPALVQAKATPEQISAYNKASDELLALKLKAPTLDGDNLSTQLKALAARQDAILTKTQHDEATSDYQRIKKLREDEEARIAAWHTSGSLRLKQLFK